MSERVEMDYVSGDLRRLTPHGIFVALFKIRARTETHLTNVARQSRLVLGGRSGVIT